MANNTITGRVVRTISHGATVYGNPMLSVVLDTDEGVETVRMMNDSGLAYGIDNPEFKTEPHTFILTAAGRIRSYQR